MNNKSQIKINLMTWTVNEVETKDNFLIENNAFCMGTCIYLSKEIFLDKNLSIENKKATLLHELAHAILYETQIKKIDKFTNEELCEFFAMYGARAVEICEQYFIDKAKEVKNER